MYSQKLRGLAAREKPIKPILAVKQRRQRYPFFFHMGPMALSTTCVLLVALMAVLYLSQLGQAVAANQAIQKARSEQAELKRQNQDLLNTIAQEQSPAYIADQAKKQGLVPVNPKDVQVLVVPNLHPVPNKHVEQNMQP